MNTAEQVSSRRSLRELLEGLVALPETPPAEFDVQVSGMQLDSRMLEEGDLFFACFGRNHDARDYIDETIDRGVRAVLAEAGGQWQGLQITKGVPVLAVDGLSSRIGEIAARFHGYPSSQARVIGITGTNGKTSCAQFLAQVLSSLEEQCGVIGTLGYGMYGKLSESNYTTPDAVLTQSALASMVAQGADTVVMEVSSQGLHQHRVKGVDFDTAVFTNLSRDHLDYHESMEAYADMKRRLFTMPGLRTAVINADDYYAPFMLNSLHSSVKSYTFSIRNSAADVYARELTLGPGGYEARVQTPWGEGTLSGSLLGYFNFSNVLAVLTVLLSLRARQGVPALEQLSEELSALRPVSGRMEIVSGEDDITAVVDYAHTPDALRCALSALRDHFKSDIWCVFGCGGNRDQGKRPIMAEVAESLADHLVITDDNPRTESADDIVKHILYGVDDRSRTEVIRDRAAAISRAVLQAAPGDVVLVAGKGHETYQDVGGQRMMFSDVNQVRLALKKRREGAAGRTRPPAGATDEGKSL